MKEIGAWLREAREERRLTLADVQQLTKIRSRYLAAIEEGDFSVLPESYARVFVRTYAMGIGLDPRPLMARFDDLQRMKQEATATPEPAQSRPRRFARVILATLNGTMEWLGL